MESIRPAVGGLFVVRKFNLKLLGTLIRAGTVKDFSIQFTKGLGKEKNVKEEHRVYLPTKHRFG